MKKIRLVLILSITLLTSISEAGSPAHKEAKGVVTLSIPFGGAVSKQRYIISSPALNEAKAGLGIEAAYMGQSVRLTKDEERALFKRQSLSPSDLKSYMQLGVDQIDPSTISVSREELIRLKANGKGLFDHQAMILPADSLEIPDALKNAYSSSSKGAKK